MTWASEVKPPQPAEADDKAVEISVAVLIKQGRVWIQQRSGTDHLDGFWEFPGGKVEPDEAIVDALVREVREEAGCQIQVELIRPIQTDLFQYPDRLVRLHFFLCPVEEGPHHVVNKGRWIRIEEINRFRMPAANEKIVRWLLDRAQDSG